MAPSSIEVETQETFSSPTLGLKVPKNAEARLLKAGVDPEHYPTRPAKPDYLDQVYAIRSQFRYFAPLRNPASMRIGNETDLCQLLCRSW